MTSDQNSNRDWLDAELAETLDEYYELELEDAVLSEEIGRIYKRNRADQIDRQIYFRELIRLQAELIRLQSWVQYTREKIVVIFEGRDSAGKGGAIKRITQRLNPRVARTVERMPPPARAISS
jgi:polyphosphate kinase 2 (PPK2 family)